MMADCIQKLFCVNSRCTYQTILYRNPSIKCTVICGGSIFKTTD